MSCKHLWGPGTPEGDFRGNLGVVKFWVWALS